MCISYDEFIKNEKYDIPMSEKEEFIRKLKNVDANVECVHKEEEVLEFIEYMILNKPEGKIIEAGCYKGGGTAKISTLSELLKKEMYVFDSFQGLPDHSENHEINIFGKPVTFDKGEYCSTYETTVGNVTNYGEVQNCTFVKGWFSDTFAEFDEEVAGAYIDVDLVQSVKECIVKFYPLLSKGGVIFCHDGHLPLVINLLESEEFWTNSVKCKKPKIEGLGTKKLLKMVKI